MNTRAQAKPARPRSRHARAAGLLFGLAAGVAAGPDAFAGLTPSQVLVLYNSQGPDGDSDGVADSLEVFTHYASVRPGVLGFDLNDPTMPTSVITHAQYETRLRNPVRAFLDNSIAGGNGQGGDIASQIVVFVLTPGLPVRIDDTDNPGIGNNTGQGVLDELVAGDSTYATVDAELTLLWQEGSTGEAGGSFDAPMIDNAALNPYHAQTTTITGTDRSGIKTPLRRVGVAENGNLITRLLDRGNTFFLLGDDTPADGGDIYLTTRLAGHTVEDVMAVIDRARFVNYDRPNHRLIFDENGVNSFDNTALVEEGAPFTDDPAYQGNDYNQAAAFAINAGYPAVLHEVTADFVIGATGSAYTGTAPTEVVSDPVAMLVTYGGNHNGGTSDNEGFLDSFAGQFVPGSVYLSAESFSARPVDGGGGFGDQGDLLEFVGLGGTFAIGQAWEPFSFSLPDAELVVQNFVFGGMTWAEAAWSAIPYLSWQHVVIGDPLATARVVTLVDAELKLTPSVSFPSEAGVTYELVRTDAGGSAVVATVTGTGGVVEVTDFSEGPIGSAKYEVRVEGDVR